MVLIRLTILCVIFVGGIAFADFETRLRNGGSPMGLQVADSETLNSDPKVYIVQLKTPAAAAFHAASAPRVAAKPSAGTLQSVPRFDKTSAAVQSHVQRLENEQAAVIAKAGPGVEQIYSYRYSLNGFAARMTPAEAAKLEHMPEVLRIWPDEIRQLATNHSANFLDLFNANTGLRGPAGLRWHCHRCDRQRYCSRACGTAGHATGRPSKSLLERLGRRIITRPMAVQKLQPRRRRTCF